jgi:catechol 2,3-dioxygenase-like lactoylglutathione lyase family enzyme
MKKHSSMIVIALCTAACIFLTGASGSDKPKSEFAKTTIDLGIVVSDVEKAVQFYTKALGFTEAPGFDVSKEMAGDSGLADYQAFSVRVLVLGEEPTATKIKIMEFPEATGKRIDNQFIHSSLGYSYITLFVSDTTAAIQRVKRAGVNLAREPYRLGGGNLYLTLIKDPDGNIIEFVGPKK